MTDFSDRLHAAFDKLTKHAEEEAGVSYSLINSPEAARTSNLSKNFLPFDNVWSQKFYGVLRRQYRHQAGTPVPESYPEMHEKIKALAYEDLITFFFRCIAAGMQVGEENTVMVRRALAINDLPELYNSEEFFNECALLAMNWQDDYSARELVGNYLEGSAVMLASQIGLPNQSSPVLINRAWDVWAVAGRSLTALTYSIGEMLGRENKENDVLQHAAEQMKENPDA